MISHAPDSEPQHRSRATVLIMAPPSVHADLATRTREMPGASVPPLGYHITMYGPFVFASLSRIRAALRAIARHTQPFTVRLEGIGYFRQPNDNVIYLRVVSNPRLLRLHARLVDALGSLTVSRHPQGPAYDRYLFVPHVSLGVHIPDALLDHDRQPAHAPPLAYGFSVERLWLLTESPGSPPVWLPVESYPLLATSAL